MEAGTQPPPKAPDSAPECLSSRGLGRCTTWLKLRSHFGWTPTARAPLKKAEDMLVKVRHLLRNHWPPLVQCRSSPAVCRAERRPVVGLWVVTSSWKTLSVQRSLCRNPLWCAGKIFALLWRTVRLGAVLPCTTEGKRRARAGAAEASG